jgi:hypothetical protein
MIITTCKCPGKCDVVVSCADKWDQDRRPEDLCEVPCQNSQGLDGWINTHVRGPW